MTETNDYAVWCHRYFEKALSLEEMGHFEQKLQTSPDLYKVFLEQKALNEKLETIGSHKRYWRLQKQAFVNRFCNAFAKRKNPCILRMCAVLGIWVFFYSPADKQTQKPPATLKSSVSIVKTQEEYPQSLSSAPNLRQKKKKRSVSKIIVNNSPSLSVNSSNEILTQQSDISVIKNTIIDTGFIIDTGRTLQGAPASPPIVSNAQANIDFEIDTMIFVSPLLDTNVVNVSLKNARINFNDTILKFKNGESSLESTAFLEFIDNLVKEDIKTITEEYLVIVLCYLKNGETKSAYELYHKILPLLSLANKSKMEQLIKKL